MRITAGIMQEKANPATFNTPTALSIFQPGMSHFRGMVRSQEITTSRSNSIEKDPSLSVKLIFHISRQDCGVELKILGVIKSSKEQQIPVLNTY